jgi:hypothetical protein
VLPFTNVFHKKYVCLLNPPNFSSNVKHPAVVAEAVNRYWPILKTIFDQ